MATRMRGRFGYQEDEPFRVTFHLEVLEKPLRWRKARRVFVCSMGDLWHPDVKHEWRRAIFRVCRQCQRHTFLFLTKRPGAVSRFAHLGNTWLGVTAENQQRAEERVPKIEALCAAVHFLSAEPMLGPITLWDSVILDWIIIGCETGPGRRNPALQNVWAQDLIRQADERKVAVFVKQLEIDRKVTSDPEDWPEWARRQEWPR